MRRLQGKASQLSACANYEAPRSGQSIIPMPIITAKSSVSNYLMTEIGEEKI